MRVGQMADRLERAGDRLDAGAGALVDADPGAGAFGADNPGRLGELGRMLHHRWSAALTARAREAAAHGARIADSAEVLRAAVSRYRDAESAARARHDIEGS
jgi:hypothetical protein